MTNKTFIKENDQEYEMVKKTIALRRPMRNKHGNILYKDALLYLVRILPENDPSYSVVLSLASFARANHLSYKQKLLADKFINWYERLWENPNLTTEIVNVEDIPDEF